MAERQEGIGELPVLAFESQAAFEDWLAAQPADASGLWLKFAKKDSGVASVSRSGAVEAALRHGWIDGQSKPLDETAWIVRFTPRRSRSKWSLKNREAAEMLIAKGRMAPAGLREVERARADGRWDAAYPPSSTATVPDDLRRALDAQPEAARAFEALDRLNRYAVLHRIHDAKKPETRARRIGLFVAMLGRGETIYPVKRKA